MANPPSSSAAAATSPLDPSPAASVPPPSATRPYPTPPLLPHPHHHFPSHSILGRPPNPPPPPQGLLFPLPHAGRGGFGPKTGTIRPPDQMVTVANPAGYIRNNSPTALLAYPVRPPFGFSHGDHAVHVQQQHHVVPVRPQPHSAAPPQFTVPRQVGGGGAAANGIPQPLPPASRGVPVSVQPKVTSFPEAGLAHEYDNYKDLREKSRDDSVVTIHDRKVRLRDGGLGSLYALCRSWVHNGLPQESQPSFGDGVRLLPRPLPATVVDTATSKKSDGEGNGETYKEEHAESVENLSPCDLLREHVRRAKRIRAQLREDRLQRIDRYKQRLSLLLPLPTEQNRNDNAAGS